MGEAGEGKGTISPGSSPGPGGAYSGRMLVDGEIYTPSEATKKFLQK